MRTGRIRLPPMATLEAFDAAARLGSFTAAGAALNLTPGAISRQMAMLEGDLGLTLFVRNPRGVELTAAGCRLHAAAAEALGTMRAAARDLRRNHGERTAYVVKVSVTPSFGARWLLPRLPRFRAAHPDVEVVPVADNRIVDITREGFDIAIRYMSTSPPQDGIKMEPWLQEELVPVAAPSLAARLDKLDRLSDLGFLHDTSESFWRHWLSAVGRPDLLPADGIVFNDYNLAAGAAVSGLGVLIGRTVLIEQEMRDGLLVEVAPRRVPSPRAYHLMRPIGSPGPAADALWQWLSLCR